MKKVIRSIKNYIYEEGFWAALFVLIFGILASPFLLLAVIAGFIDDWFRELCKPDD